MQKLCLDDSGETANALKKYIWWEDQNPCKFPRGKGKKRKMFSSIYDFSAEDLAPSLQSRPASAGYEN